MRGIASRDGGTSARGNVEGSDPMTRIVIGSDPFYSYLNASIGSRCAARRAGYKPNTRPTDTDTRNASRIELAVTIVDQPAKIPISCDIPTPTMTPIVPPTNEIKIVSIRN